MTPQDGSWIATVREAVGIATALRDDNRAEGIAGMAIRGALDECDPAQLLRALGLITGALADEVAPHAGTDADTLVQTLARAIAIIEDGGAGGSE